MGGGVPFRGACLPALVARVKAAPAPDAPFSCSGGGGAKATRTAQPFNAPPGAVTPRSRDGGPHPFVTAIESRDTPRLHPGDMAADTLLEAPPPPPAPAAGPRAEAPAPGLDPDAIAEAAAALSKLDAPARGAPTESAPRLGLLFFPCVLLLPEAGCEASDAAPLIPPRVRQRQCLQ